MSQYSTKIRSGRDELFHADRWTDWRRDGRTDGQIDTNAHDKAKSRVLQHSECAHTDTKTLHLHSFLILALLYLFIRKCNHIHKYVCTNTRIGQKISIYVVGPMIWQLQNLGTPCMQQMSPFPALKKNHGGHKCSDGREADTVVTRRLVTQDTDFIYRKLKSSSVNTKNASTVPRTGWKSRGIGKKVKQSRYRPGQAQRVPGS